VQQVRIEQSYVPFFLSTRCSLATLCFQTVANQHP